MGASILPVCAKELEELAARGLSLEMIAQQLCITRQTLSKRLKDNLTLQTAYKRGCQQDVQDVVNALKENALKGNVVAQIFFLKNKGKEDWKDKHEVNHSGGLTVNTGFQGRTIEHEE